MQTNNTLPHTLQPLQLHKKASQQTQPQHPSSAWILAKALVSRLPVLLLLWSTCWMLTGCDVPGSSLTPQPSLQTQPVEQAVMIEFRDFLYRNELGEVWKRLQSAKTNQQQTTLDLTGMLQGRSAEVQIDVLKSVLQFIGDHCPNLVNLDLSHNGLTQLPDSFGTLTQLQMLVLHHNQLTTLPNSLVNLINLHTLDLKHNQLTQLPVFLKRLPKLAIFSVINNPLSCPSVDIVFEYLLKSNGLQEVLNRLLDVQKNQKNTLDLTGMLQGRSAEVQIDVLKGLVHCIVNHCPNLVNLDLSHNGLTQLPDSFGTLTQLQILKLNNNQLTVLPDTFGGLIHLKELDLLNNQLTQLQDTLDKLINLQTLFLEDNHLAQLPGFFKDHPNLIQITTAICNDSSSYSSKDLAFGQFICNRGLHEIWYRLMQAKTNQSTTLNLSGQLQNCAPVLQIQVLAGVVDFIRTNCLHLVSLDLSYNKLTLLPKSFRDLTQLQELRLDNNELKALPKSFEKLTNLTTFTAINNPLSCPSLDIAFGYFLRNNGLQEILNRLQDARKNQKNSLTLSGLLQTCTPEVRSYVLGMIVHFIGDHCPKLVSLDLSHNGLTTLPKSLLNLTQLKNLSLDNNQLTVYPVFSQSQPHITVRNNPLGHAREDIPFESFLKNNDLYVIWQRIVEAQQNQSNTLNLVALLRGRSEDLQTSVLQLLVDCMRAHLPNVVNLNLNHNELKKLPECLQKLTNLQTLCLDHNQLKKLPACLQRLTNLQMLSVNSNQLEHFPKSLEKLSNLKALYLNNNQIQTLPIYCEKLLEKFPKLTSIGLTNSLVVQPQSDLEFECLLINNGLREIWSRLQSAKTYKDIGLNLSGTLSNCPTAMQIKVLERVFEFICSHCPNLVELNLSNNHLAVLPNSLGYLFRLKRLYLQQNQLIRLPDTFSNLEHLQILNLDNNQLQQLPAFLCKLPTLFTFTVSGNPLSSASLDIAFSLFFKNYGLPHIWNRLVEAKLNQQNALNLSGMMQTCTPAVQNHVLGMVATFILNHCPNVVNLNLSANGLTALPDAFGNLTQLRILNLYQNQLKALPESFVDLTNLQALIIEYTQMHLLTVSLVNHLPNLKVINGTQ